VVLLVAINDPTVPETEQVDRHKPKDTTVNRGGPVPIVKMAPQAANSAAFLEAAATGRSYGDIEELRKVYELNGKSTDFQVNLELWKQARTVEAKQRIYDRVALKSASLPQQLDFNNPEHFAAAQDIVSQYQATEGVEAIDLAARTLLQRAAASDITNPNEYSIQKRLFENPQLIAAEIANTVRGNTEELARFHAEQPLYSKGFINGAARRFVEFLPYLIPGYETAATYRMLKASGVEEIGLWKALAGEGTQRLREHILALPPAEQKATYAKLRKFLTEDWMLTDLAAMDLASSVLTSEMIDEGTSKSSLDRLLRNLGTVLDVAALGPLTRILGKQGVTIAQNTALATVQKTNRRGYQRILADLLAETDKNKVLKNWGVVDTDIVLTQLPMPPRGIVQNAPDGIAEAAAHATVVREEIETLLKHAKDDVFTNKEVVGAVEREALKVEQAFGAKLRLGRSSISIFDDKSGVRFGSVIGSSDTHGWANLEDAIGYARTLDEGGTKLTILRANKDGDLVPYLKGSSAVDTSLKEQGEFYVKYDQDYFFTPQDKLLFGEDPVVAPTWLGRSTLWVTTPSAAINPVVYNRFVRAFLTEQSLASNMDRLIAPLFKELNGKQRQLVGEMWEWTEAYGKRESKVPSWDDLRQAFPDATDKELLGWYRVRNFYDTAFLINNDRLYREFSTRGYKTLSAGNTRYHGAPMTEESITKYKANGGYTVYDPIRNTPLFLTPAQMKKVFKDGGSILETPIPISAGKGDQLATLVVHTPGSGTELRALSQQPLKHIPGYYPRLYEDPIFIRRVIPNARINGIVTEHRTTVATATTRKEAEEFVARMNRGAKGGEVYAIDEIDPRLADADRTSRDLERMQLEGRIFFDERNTDPLASVRGGRADVVDPINALHRTSRMLSRQVATEDVVRTMKAQFFQEFAGILPANVAENMSSSAVSAELRRNITQGGKVLSKEATKANVLWDYIRVMEGSLYGGGTEFRRAAVRASEFVANNLLPKRSKVATLMVRNAEKVAPVEWMKTLAFFDFMTTRPLRQLFLQGSQHVMLQALDPKYAGKWQFDTMLLMSGARGKNLALAGLAEQSDALIARNSKLMGLSKEEYSRLLTEFDRSGVAQAVNLHTFAGDMMMDAAAHRTTPAGRGLQTAANTATAKPVRDALNRYGFVAGEQFNVAASYMMALRRIMSENNYKSLLELKPEDWARVQTRGSNYALAMHRANASKYQYGLLSLPMQFLSFTHKVALTFLRALPAKAGGNLGNKAFTQAEAGKIIAGQYLLFGAAGFGVKPEIESWLTENNMEHYVGTTVVDLLSGGVLDMLLDSAVQKAVGDPELDLPFDEFLAPGANIINTMRMFWEAAVDKVPVESVLGPSLQTTSRILESAAVAGLITSVDFPEYTPAEEFRIVLDAVLGGVASGYNDYMQAKLMYHTGMMLSTGGVPHHMEASRAEALAKGLFGVTSEKQRDLWHLTKDIRAKEQDLKAIAAEYHSRHLKLAAMYETGQWTSEYYRNKIAMERSVLGALDPEERTFVMAEFNALEKKRQASRDGVSDMVMRGIERNVPMPADWLTYRIEKSTAIKPEDKEPLVRLIQNEAQMLREAGNLWDSQLAQADSNIVEFDSKLRANEEQRAQLKRYKEAKTLREKAAIAREMGATQEEIDAIMSRAPARER